MSQLRRRALLVGVVVLALHAILVTSLAPIILIPGFMSSRLLAWRHKSCDTFDINVGDRVWLDVTHVVYDSFREDCWVSCMMFEDTLEQEDTDCRLRAVSSIEAISELEPGQITGYLSAIFRDIIKLLAQEFGYDPSNVQAAPYDWRLPPSMLQKRDNYFTNLRHTLEDMVSRNAEPAIIIAHSMGNNVFLYFVEWMKRQPDLQGKDAYQQWFDTHINAWVNVAGPLLGAPGTLRSVLSGFTFGLPISEIAMKRMGSTFGSFGMLLPLVDNSTKTSARPASGWSLNSITVDYRDRGKPTKSYGAKDHHELFKDMGDEYSDMTHLLPIVLRYYDQDPLTSELMKAPKRPPLRNVYCIYGINEPTEIGYHYKATEDGPVLKKWLWEGDGGELYSTSFTAIKSQSLGFSDFLKSGDGSVPYTSLSWCNSWHLSEPEITHTQTTFEDGNTRLPLFRRMIGTQTQVFGQGRYESVHEGRRTIVVELEKINHRHVIRSQKLLEILVDELPKLRRYYNQTAVSEDERDRAVQQQHEKEREQQLLQQLQQQHPHHTSRVPEEPAEVIASIVEPEADDTSTDALIEKYTRLTKRLESLLQTAQSRLVELHAKNAAPGSTMPITEAEHHAAASTELDVHDCSSLLDEQHPDRDVCHHADETDEIVCLPGVPHELRGPFVPGEGEAELRKIADREDEQFDDYPLE